MFSGLQSVMQIFWWAKNVVVHFREYFDSAFTLVALSGYVPVMNGLNVFFLYGLIVCREKIRRHWGARARSPSYIDHGGERYTRKLL